MDIEMAKQKKRQPGREAAITVRGRGLVIPPQLNSVAVENDRGSVCIPILCPRRIKGQELSRHSFFLRTLNVKGGYDAVPLPFEEQGEMLRLQWVLRPPQTSYSGRLMIQLWITGEDFDWQTAAAPVNIIRQLGGEPAVPATPSMLDSFLKTFQQLEMSMQASERSAASSASSAAGFASAAGESAAEAGGSQAAAAGAAAAAAGSACSAQENADRAERHALPVRDAAVNEDGRLTLTLGDGSKLNAGPVVGPPGIPGPGIPAGGSSGQLLVKAGPADYAARWEGAGELALQPPKAYAGPSPIALATRSTDKVYVDFEGGTAVSGTPSPDNPVTLTGVPFAATASDGTGQTRSISLGFTGYSLPDGVKDTYDGKTGELVQRVRRIVLGEDSSLAFSNDGSTQTVWYTVYENGEMVGDSAERVNMLSTHFINRNSYGTNVEGVYGGRGTPPYTVAISIFKSRLAPYGLVDGTTNTYVPAAKAWAKAQADAGTPVTILYEPEEPTSSCHKADIPAFMGTTTVTGAAAAGVIDDRVLRFNGLLPFEVQPSHPNLLDNPDLEINQRGKQEYTSGNTVDRWRINGSATNMSYAVGSKTLSCTPTTNSFVVFEQLIEAPSRLAGKTVTFSALFESANRMLIQIWRTNSSGTVSIKQSASYWSNNLFATLTCVIPEDVTDSDTIRCLIQTQNSVKIIAAKLELGSQQTLARKIGGTWVLNDPPPNKALELAKCQRYLKMFKLYEGFMVCSITTNYVDFIIPVGVDMRATPSLIGNGFGSFNTEEGWQLSIVSNGTSGIRVRATKQNHGINLQYTPVINSGSGLSAEL